MNQHFYSFQLNKNWIRGVITGNPALTQRGIETRDTQQGEIEDWEVVMAPTNKQWVSKLDGAGKLELVEGEMPVPKDGEVLVKINAVCLNYRDIEGMFPWLD